MLEAAFIASTNRVYVFLSGFKPVLHFKYYDPSVNNNHSSSRVGGLGREGITGKVREQGHKIVLSTDRTLGQIRQRRVRAGKPACYLRGSARPHFRQSYFNSLRYILLQTVSINHTRRMVDRSPLVPDSWWSHLSRLFLSCFSCS